ncbi:MAG: hypothetical protein OSA99_13135 [Acidimicrobiales bacterium]|nr:hypothetical protein [Acidimicrobiales bacterium]
MPSKRLAREAPEPAALPFRRRVPGGPKEQMAHLLDRGTPDSTPTDALDVVTACEVDLLAGRVDRWMVPGPRVPHGVAARAQVLAGRPSAARALLDDAPPVAEWSPRALASAAWAISRVGSPRLAEVESALDTAGSSDRFLYEGDVPLGPTDSFLGILVAAAGELDRGARCLRAAAAVADERSPSWGAQVRHELVRVLLDAAVDGDADASAERDSMRTMARMFYVSAGYDHQRERLDAVGSPDPGPRASAGCGILEPGPRWTVGFGVQPPVTVRPSKGLLAIHHLIRHRDRRVPAVELDAVVQSGAEPGLAALRTVIDRAVECGGEDDLRVLLHDDQVRTRVTKLVRRTIARIGDEHRRLGDHLEAMVETGYSCAYVGDRIPWATGPAAVDDRAGTS